jgi:hypothetical protein
MLPNDPLRAGAETNGTTAGAYASTGAGAACDVKALVSYFVGPQHPAQSRAWAGVIGIDPHDIPAYFAKLTPVRLRVDTRVTNYDYKDGHADGFQAVLQAGTSVLVDNHGVPRAKCNCGNPLTEPRSSASPTGKVSKFARNPSEAWSGFSPRKTVTFTPGPQVDHFVLLDLDDGTAHVRHVGSDGTSDTPLDRGDPACRALRQSTSCGGPGPRPTPTDAASLESTARRLTKAVRDGDCNALVDSISTATAERLGLSRQRGVANCELVIRQLQSLGGITFANVRVVSQTGSHAVISETYTVGGQTATGEDHLVRENGNWKIEIPS